jgi:hypothetical protein
MLSLFESPDFWKAIASISWPIAILVIFFNLKDKLYKLLGRDNLTIKVAGMELSVADATKSIGESVSDLQKKLSDLESRILPLLSSNSVQFERNTADSSNLDVIDKNCY